MATLTIRNLDDELRTQLRLRAAGHGRSMEAEVRAILSDVLTKPAPPERLGSRIHARFADLGGLDIEPPKRAEQPRAADLPE